MRHPFIRPMGHAMGKGLKDQWGVSDPAKVGSDKQAQQFQASFQKEIACINGHLQYTSANAEAARQAAGWVVRPTRPLSRWRNSATASWRPARSSGSATRPPHSKAQLGSFQI